MPTPATSPPIEPAPAQAPRIRVSEAEYWARYYECPDNRYEWNNGYLEVKPVSDFLTFWIYAWLIELLTRFLKAHPIADAVGLDIGFRLALADKVVIRKPDLAVVRRDNRIGFAPLDRSYRGVYDLCIEALSDSDEDAKRRDTLVKKAEYAAGGVREYYILHHEPENLAFYGRTPDGSYRPLPEDRGLVASRVLPGFRFRRRDLLERTSIDSLRDDPVYRDFLFPQWRLAEQSRERAEREREQAERERDALLEERRAAILRLHAIGLDRAQIAGALGVDPDRIDKALGKP